MSEITSNDKCLDLLMQSKQLVHTSYEVTAIQNRIFYYCLLTAQKEKNGELSCTVKLEDLKKLIPNKNQRTLSNIKKTIQILKQTSLEFEKKEDGDTIECDYNLIAGSEYNVNKETFKIKLADRLYRHLIDYTVYAPLNLEILTKFKSFYAQRLYELLRLWSRTDMTIIKNFKIDQLRFVLGVENKYPEYKNFKQRVLSQAIKEINKLGNMEVSIDEIKNGRKVDEIKFTIYDFEKKIYFKNTIDNPIIEVKNVNKEDIENEDITTVETNNIKDVFYVPNKKLFTSKTLEYFKNDFSNYDFKDNKYKKILQESITITLEKDDEEKIKVKSYNYFKGTLKNKINDLKNLNESVTRVKARYYNENEEEKSKEEIISKQKQEYEMRSLKNKAHNVNAAFLNYTPEELERHLQESQRNKFK